MTPQTTLLPFDLAKALAGAPLATKHEVPAFGFEKDPAQILPEFPYRAWIDGALEYFTENGKWLASDTDPRDLFLIADSAQEAGAETACPECGEQVRERNGEDVKFHKPGCCKGQRDPNNDDELKAAREEIKAANAENRRLDEQLNRHAHAVGEYCTGAPSVPDALRMMRRQIKELGTDKVNLRSALTAAEQERDKAVKFAKDCDNGKWLRMKVAENESDDLRAELKKVRETAVTMVKQAEAQRDALQKRRELAFKILEGCDRDILESKALLIALLTPAPAQTASTEGEG